MPTGLKRHAHAAGLLRRLWSAEPNEVGSFAGERYGFDAGVFAPVPSEAEGVRIMVDGTSGAALRRARFADVRHAVGIDSDEFAHRREQLRRLAGRDLEVGVRTGRRDVTFSAPAAS